MKRIATYVGKEKEREEVSKCVRQLLILLKSDPNLHSVEKKHDDDKVI